MLNDFVHGNWLGIVVHRPYARGTDSGTDSAADALIGINHIFEAPRFVARITRNRILRTGFHAHMAVATGATTDTAIVFFFGTGQIAAVTFFKIGSLESSCRNLIFLFSGVLRSHQIGVH